MRDPRRWIISLFLTGAAGIFPALFLEGVRFVADAPFSWVGLVSRWAFVAGILIAAVLSSPHPQRLCRYPLPSPEPCSEEGRGCRRRRQRWGEDPRWRWPGLLWLGLGLVAGLAYARTGATWAAWALTGTAWILLLGLADILTGVRSRLRRWVWRGILALTAGAFPVALSQLESRFADEEFFVALEAVALALFWLLLLSVYRLSLRWTPVRLRWGVTLERRATGLVFLLLAFGGLNGTVWAYRHSFYPPVAPTYPGISEESPFLCGQVPPDTQTYDGRDVFFRILARVEANPRKGPPEYGMLALGTGDRRWAEAFRESLLAEVAEGRYTGPAHSVKSVQFEAALRAYYYPRVRDRFPGLFSEEEQARIQAWFAAVNRRALTVEWVDLMYALAFSKWPEGPYENQENGAGLLALLEAEGLADPNLSAANRAYLARNRRGWAERFRVTDDAIVYQPEWILNAYFQSLYTGEFPEENARRSFEWLLLQALPDGASLRYNHPGQGSLAGIAYLGATLFRDPRYIWLAGRAVETLEQEGRYLFAQPGVEEPVPLEGRSPTEGSCLLYGNSGLPNQKGPLAPDKIVFRDGWGKDARYLLVNLRFTGWHRYKATGTVTLVYWGEPLSADVLDGKPFSWLPVGRSLFRDKRVPRENLNGLVVEKTGMAAVLYGLTGVGGPWAQDPPYYAEVVAFETGPEKDWAHIRLTDWRGWQHDRWVYFYHNGGPIVIVDEAQGPAGAKAGLVWHLIGGERIAADHFRLGSSNVPVEVRLLPLDGSGRVESRAREGSMPGWEVEYWGATGTRAAMVIASDEWRGAEIFLNSKRLEISTTSSN
ncbi:MAG: hypothetical protein H5T61_11080 [Thermoflexales bacterium]|nr:hypothetical protein [Thermoflexales bacterium]